MKISSEELDMMRLVRILIGQRLIAACVAIALSSLSLADTEMGEDLYLNTEFSRVMNGEPRDDVTCSDCHDPGFYTSVVCSPFIECSAAHIMLSTKLW